MIHYKISERTTYLVVTVDCTNLGSATASFVRTHNIAQENTAQENTITDCGLHGYSLFPYFL